MDYGKEFEKFAIKDQGINSNYYSKIIESMYPTNMTPNIIEERQHNCYSCRVLMLQKMFKFISTHQVVQFTQVQVFMIQCNL